jgi:ribonucleoside-diphosphate reductase alpha chain
METEKDKKRSVLETNSGRDFEKTLHMKEIEQNLALSPLARSVLQKRYLRKNGTGQVVETPEQMFRRVATKIAEVEASYGASDSQIKAVADKFFELMVKSNFIPNSPTLMNAARENGMLSACFVLPIEDSIDGIFETVKNTALIQKAGGGTGFSFDKLRPTGDLVSSSGGTTSGPISFWWVIAETTNAIQQGAFRRGANMGMMSIEHPDILKFINAKSDPRAFNNFNISIKIPDGFMKKLLASPDVQHVVVNPRTNKKYSIPRTLEINSYTINDLMPEEQASNGSYTVKEIWGIITANAHANGEPGVCYIDRVNENNPTPTLGQIQATNPCGEQPLLSTYE